MSATPTPRPVPPAICFVTTSYPPDIGGVAVSSARLVRHLSRAGFRVHVVAGYAEPNARPRVERAEEEHAVVHRVFFAPERWEAQFFFRQFVRDLDRTVGFDLFHGFFLTTVPACMHAAGPRGDRPARPVIVSARGSDAEWQYHHPVARRVIVSGLRRASWLTTVSRAALDALAPLAGLTDRCSVMPPGAPPLSARPWELTGSNQGVVGTVGDFRPVKDIPLLVRGYAAVPASLRRRLVLAGAFRHPREEAWSNTLIDELGVRAEVELTGRFERHEVETLLRRMHVFVLSSASEGVPNGLLEAGALGVPVVATAVGGVRELVRDGVDGLLVPHGEPAQLGGAIARVLGDAGLARRLSDGGRRMAAALSEEREGEAWIALHRRVLEGDRRS